MGGKVMKRRVAVTLLFTLLGVVCQAQTSTGPEAVTFNKDVAPILYRNCTVCHHPDDIAPMSLVTYKEVRPWAAAIREAVVQRKMPPWHADPHIGDFLNNPRLSDSEIETIVNWVKSGSQEGNPQDLPPVPVFETGWQIKPDVVIAIPQMTVA